MRAARNGNPEHGRPHRNVTTSGVAVAKALRGRLTQRFDFYMYSEIAWVCLAWRSTNCASLRTLSAADMTREMVDERDMEGAGLDSN